MCLYKGIVQHKGLTDLVSESFKTEWLVGPVHSTATLLPLRTSPFACTRTFDAE